MAFPPNLDMLNNNEQIIRSKSREAVEASEHLSLHFRMIEASMNLAYHFAGRADRTDDDDLVIRRLGFRLFNSMASAVGTILTGYYQTSVLIAADILEIHCLIEYFGTDKSMIGRWRTLGEKERNKLFRPAVIRKALDDRDGLPKRRREDHYKTLCGLGAHASMRGFRLLQPARDGLSHCGPFFAPAPLDSVGSELAKIAGHAASQYALWFEAKTVTDHGVKLSFCEAQEAWLCQFCGKEPNRAAIDAMRGELARTKQAASTQRSQ